MRGPRFGLRSSLYHLYRSGPQPNLGPLATVPKELYSIRQERDDAGAALGRNPERRASHYSVARHLLFGLVVSHVELAGKH
jgi:hypothetical protein